MICIYHNDLDGKCAAAIVAKKFNGMNERLLFLKMDYKDHLELEKIGVVEDVIIVDFSFNPEMMDLLTSHTAGEITWIDHHVTAKDFPYQYLSGLRNFGEKDSAGCELTWEYFLLDDKVPLAVQLIGDYDKWALKLSDSKSFYEGMKLVPNEPSSSIWEKLFYDNANCKRIIQMGKVAILYQDNYCENLCKSFGYKTELDGIKAYACNQYMFGSGGFGKRFHEYPICIAYIHDGEKFMVSLYSETVDVGQIAKRHGGGGHKGASGFICEELPFKRSLMKEMAVA